MHSEGERAQHSAANTEVLVLHSTAALHVVTGVCKLSRLRDVWPLLRPSVLLLYLLSHPPEHPRCQGQEDSHKQRH